MNGDACFGFQHYTLTIVFDLLSVIQCFKYMHGKSSFMTMDGTMFGECPKVVLSSSTTTQLTTHISETTKTNNGYHTVTYWNLYNDKSTGRADSQNDVVIPTVEVHVHHYEKAGEPAHIIDLGNRTAMQLLRQALKKARSVLPSNSLPIDLSLAFVEIDNCKAERLANALCFGRETRRLQERYHTKKCGTNFIEGTRKMGVFTDSDVIQASIFLNDYFCAKSEISAQKSISDFTNLVTTCTENPIISQEIKVQVITKFANTVREYVFQDPKAACDFGRMKIQKKMASGPTAENVNSCVKGRIGKSINYVYIYMCVYIL